MKAQSSTRWMLAILLLLSGVGFVQAESKRHEAATAIVRDLQDALLASMKAGNSLDFSQRRQRLHPVVERTHHFRAITRFILGRHSDSLEEQQLAEVAEHLLRLSVVEYTSRFNRYNNERLRVLDTEAMAAERVRVETELIKADGEAVRLEYMLQRDNDAWGIVNVVADGVSDLALKRGEYSRLLAREGYEALLEGLRREAEEIGPG